MSTLNQPVTPLTPDDAITADEEGRRQAEFERTYTGPAVFGA